jgi:short-subunit dehydrogenase
MRHKVYLNRRELEGGRVSRVLVTGCSSGIGRAVALEMARQGHEVIATARSGRSIADLAVAERYEMDITDNAQVLDVAARVGPVDVLINNAGTGLHGPLEVVPMEAIEEVYQTNVLGTLRITKALLPSMRARGNGTICFVSSPAGQATRPLTGTYGGSKAAVELQLESLSFELEDTGGRVIIFSPGAVSSNFPARRTGLVPPVAGLHAGGGGGRHHPDPGHRAAPVQQARHRGRGRGAARPARGV